MRNVPPVFDTDSVVSSARSVRRTRTIGKTRFERISAFSTQTNVYFSGRDRRLFDESDATVVVGSPWRIPTIRKGENEEADTDDASKLLVTRRPGY